MYSLFGYAIQLKLQTFQITKKGTIRNIFTKAIYTKNKYKKKLLKLKCCNSPRSLMNDFGCTVPSKKFKADALRKLDNASQTTLAFNPPCLLSLEG